VFPQPYWGYDDLGIFLLILVLLTPMFRLCVRFHLLAASDLAHPTTGLQFVVVAFVSLALYLVLRLRHQQPVVRPLGWVLPSRRYMFLALLGGVVLATAVAIYLSVRHESTPRVPVLDFLLLVLIFGPVLEESLFRGCLLPLLAQTTGAVAAVILTALCFALFHGPTDLPHWVSFTTTGLAYGWMRMASRSTIAAALMHATYNLILFLLASF
jgi:membrane protease YdiL (CAAX protease family)